MARVTQVLVNLFISFVISAGASIGSISWADSKDELKILPAPSPSATPKQIQLFYNAITDPNMRVTHIPKHYEDTIDANIIDAHVGVRSEGFEAMMKANGLDPNSSEVLSWELGYRFNVIGYTLKDIGVKRVDPIIEKEGVLGAIRTEPTVQAEVDRQLRLTIPNFDSLPPETQQAIRELALGIGHKMQAEMIEAEMQRQTKNSRKRLGNFEEEQTFYSDFRVRAYYVIGKNDKGQPVRMAFVDIGKYRPDHGAPMNEYYRAKNDEWFIVPNPVAHSGGVGATGTVSTGVIQQLPNNLGQIQISATAFANRPVYNNGLTEYAGAILILDDRQYKAYERWYEINSSILRVLYTKGDGYAYVSAGTLGGQIALNPEEPAIPGVEPPSRGPHTRYVTNAGFAVPLWKGAHWGMDFYFGNRREVGMGVSTTFTQKVFEKYIEWADAKVLVVAGIRAAHLEDAQRVMLSIYERESWEELSFVTQARFEKTIWTTFFWKSGYRGSGNPSF